MNEYRLTDEGRLESFSGRVLRHDGRVYVNPKQEVLRAAGYKPLLRDPVPADAGQKDERGTPVVYAPVYTDVGDAIRLSYERGDYPDDED
ncbi:MAG: hypothetical protein J6X72_07200 [Clostridia bacterium]|nr:hypothetical protein [Clostridia bacterium]